MEYTKPIRDDEGKLTPEGWLRMFVMSQVVIGLFQMFYIIISFAGIFSGGIAFPNFFGSFLLLLSLIFIPTSIYLLIKKSYWGWALTFGSTIIYVISLLQKLFLYYNYSMDGSLSKYYSFAWKDGFWLAVHVGFLVFLLQEAIKDLFGVNKKIIINTIVATAAFLLILYALA